MILEEKIISGKGSVVSFSAAGGLGGTLSPSLGILGGQRPLRKFKALKSI